MFERKEEIAQAVTDLYAIASKMKRGETLLHTQIQAVLNLKPHEGRWDHIVWTVRKKLQNERGIGTWFVREVGYELLTAHRQVEAGSWQTRKAYRSTRRGRKTVEALPDKGLSDNQRRAKHFMADTLRAAEKSLRRDLREQGNTIKATPVIARRQVS